MAQFSNVSLELIIIFLIFLIKKGLTISCYVCDSYNGSDPGCVDPFHPDKYYYEPQCMQGMKERVGLFPAAYCVKMNGRSLSTGVEIMVRFCTIETMDHHCGIFNFEDEMYSGCLTTCTGQACNGLKRLCSNFHTIGIIMITLAFLQNFMFGGYVLVQ